ncbi:MAG TPA: helix-turn-helix domain-containing protein [Pyrinomonadaceae bacterium]|nr:helix-turn-helix domain-containing protein [Pyrinomonadaceae bacterium]
MSELIYAGQYEAARDELGELWAGIGERPQLDFAPQVSAEVLLQCGTLSGWLGSANQLDVQEKAKDLVTEALRIFQSLNLKTKASEAQYELGMCYFRNGAYDEARIVLDEAREGLKDDELESKILIRQTIVEIWVGKYLEAWRMLEKAQTTFENSDDALKGRWHGQMALVLRRLATTEGRTDYFDKAIIEYTAAIYHYEQAKHGRYCASNLNNLAFLLYKLDRYEEAHEHLDRARTFLERLKDVGLLAQVEETRSRVLIAEERYVEARRVILDVVRTFEKGGEQALLANALTLQAIIEANLKDYDHSLDTFRNAINTAENAGALSNAGRAAMSMIEEHGAGRLSEREIYEVYRRADRWLAVTQDAEDIARLRACARIVMRKLYGPELDEYFTLPETVLQYEARFIEQALEEERGSISRAAHRLGLSHQTLGAMIQTRHRSLTGKRNPEIKRKRNIVKKR